MIVANNVLILRRLFFFNSFSTKWGTEMNDLEGLWLMESSKYYVKEVASVIYPSVNYRQCGVWSKRCQWNTVTSNLFLRRFLLFTEV